MFRNTDWPPQLETSWSKLQLSYHENVSWPVTRAKAPENDTLVCTVLLLVYRHKPTRFPTTHAPKDQLHTARADNLYPIPWITATPFRPLTRMLFGSLRFACRGAFRFAVALFVLPWRFLFCRGAFCFAVALFVLPWQLWATVADSVLTVMQSHEILPCSLGPERPVYPDRWDGLIACTDSCSGHVYSA